MGKSADCVLAVDLGTGGPKVAVVSPEGEVLAHAFEPVELILLDGGGAEQDPDDWWAAIVGATQKLFADPDVDGGRIAAICMTGQWCGTVAVDANGRPVHNALTWLDSRGEPYVRRLVGGGLEVPGTGYNARKLVRWLRRNGGVPTLSGKDPVGQIQWLRHTHPDAYAETTSFLDVPEYLTMRLSGLATASYDTIASRWCTDNRDLSAITFDEQLVAAGGLDRSKLPSLVPGASLVGPILATAAAELGVGEDVQVVVGCGDTLAAAVGSGAVEDYCPHLYVGTSAWFTAHVPFKKTNALQAISTLPSVVPDRYWVATIQDVAGKAVSWMIEDILWPDEASRPADPLAHLNRLAASAPAGSNGVLFFPWLNGERTPIEDENLRGAWFNLSLSTDHATLARSLMEGIALNTRWMVEAVGDFVGPEGAEAMKTVRFIGGGASSSLWCQIMADVLGVKIQQVHDPVLANVRGAGLIGQVALGRITWADIPARVKIAAEFSPVPDNQVIYDRIYTSFRRFHKQNKALYADLNKA